MLLEVAGKRYPVKRMEELELRHVAQLQFELGSGQFDKITSLRTMNDIARAFGEWATSGKRATPDGLFLTCFTVWAARVMAGEDLTLMEAISVPADSVRWIAEPSDEQPEDVDAGKARGAQAAPPRKRKKRH